MKFITSRIYGIVFGLMFAFVTLISPKIAIDAMLDSISRNDKVKQRLDELSK